MNDIGDRNFRRIDDLFKECGAAAGVACCDSCAERKLCGFVDDPYELEIAGKRIAKWLCHSCYNEKELDI